MNFGTCMRFAASAAAVFALMTTSGLARAGTLQVRDEAHLLSPADIEHARSAVSTAPFDARVLVTNDHPDAEDLSRYTHTFVSRPDMVVVGLDPQHHRVQVHFGTGTGIPSSSWSTIEQSGNRSFSRGDWQSGLISIFGAAAQSVGEPAAGAPAIPQRGSPPSLFGPGTLLFLLVGVLGAFFVLSSVFRRRRSMNGFGYGGGYGGPPYPGPGYGYGPPQGGIGPLGGGLLGAGLGGVAGYEIGKLEGEREQRDQDRGNDWNGGSGDGGNFDAGGGGSNWGGDGGGGFDGGGGGSDGGGGGSDF